MSAIAGRLPLSFSDRESLWFLSILAVIAIAVPILNLAVPPSSPLHVSTYVLTLVGKYLCYAMLAIAPAV